MSQQEQVLSEHVYMLDEFGCVGDHYYLFRTLMDLLRRGCRTCRPLHTKPRQSLFDALRQH